MQHTALATRYRPQTFADVTGQDMVKAILSRAAETDNVAPAYLLSGTRGVGKTTLARVFAKALNCVNAPTAEPCNVCDQCKRIVQGNHVDVLEIDGASNRGIDDARRLREIIAYAPMEGRYKVIIIDEAHMLTRESFNALLKTLEEPPPRTTFILATTESHKFPITIISRCQHFTLKALTEDSLTDHLQRILNAENIKTEASALRLLARRAAGSVRDGMSLLSQVIALGEGDVTEAAVRSLLGLAGHEAYERILKAIQARSCIDVVTLSQELLERGLDIGFFLRELALLWRNLLLLHEAGDGAAKAIDMPEADIQRLQALAKQFDRAYIHAAWHMVLEHQRQILQSLEPATALELLLINLVLLSDLVSLEHLSRVERLTRPLTRPLTTEKPADQVTQATEQSAIQTNQAANTSQTQVTEQIASQAPNTSQAQVTEQIASQAPNASQAQAASFAGGASKLQHIDTEPSALAGSTNTELATAPKVERDSKQESERSIPPSMEQGTGQNTHHSHEAFPTQNIEQDIIQQGTQETPQQGAQETTQQTAQQDTQGTQETPQQGTLQQEATQNFTLKEHNEIAASLPATHLEHPITDAVQPAMPQDIEELINAATASIPQQATRPQGFGNMLSSAVDIEAVPTSNEQGEQDEQNEQGSSNQDISGHDARAQELSDQEANTKFNQAPLDSNVPKVPDESSTPAANNDATNTDDANRLAPPKTSLAANTAPPYKVQTEGQLKTQMQNHPTVQVIKETFDASLLRCYQKKT